MTVFQKLVEHCRINANYILKVSELFGNVLFNFNLLQMRPQLCNDMEKSSIGTRSGAKTAALNSSVA